MTAYYNENDPKAAAWLRELIKRGLIAPGVVDERSILDVLPNDLAGYDQCHFFAGIGVWSYALRCAGWSDNRPVWTGSCPCQPFSAAGKGAGVADERHLWPAWFHLIGECRPHVLFGEQVAAAIRHSWLDLVQSDMEGLGYAFAPFGLPAAGFGAPHIRFRLYFMAHAQGAEQQRAKSEERRVIRSGATGELEHPPSERCGEARRSSRRPEEWTGDASEPEFVGDAKINGCKRRSVPNNGESQDRITQTGVPGPTNGFWSNAEWIACRDEKARPVEPGTFPLAYGTPARVGRLRGYGNAIVASVAQEFIQTYMMRWVGN